MGATGRRELGLGLIFALLVHGGGWWWLGTLEATPTPVEPPRQVARTVDFEVKLPTPPPKPAPTPTEPVAPPPRQLAQQTPAPPPKAAAKASKAPRKASKARGGKRTAARPAVRPSAPPPAPAPLMLSQVYEGAGAVQVMEGEQDVLGNPAIAIGAPSTPRVPDPTRVDVDDVGQLGGAGDEAEEERQVRIVHAAPRERCRVQWPEGALTGNRVVEVKLQLTVDGTGRVSRARVIRGSGEPFDSAAVAALKGCAFVPGQRDGRPFVDRVPFTVAFKPGSAG